jgi:hypothetical protein
MAVVSFCTADWEKNVNSEDHVSPCCHGSCQCVTQFFTMSTKYWRQTTIYTMLKKIKTVPAESPNSPLIYLFNKYLYALLWSSMSLSIKGIVCVLCNSNRASNIGNFIKKRKFGPPFWRLKFQGQALVCSGCQEGFLTSWYHGG